jgi:glucose-6-phosphate 1-dehydrogenase
MLAQKEGDMSATQTQNPLREGMVEERLPEPCTMVIFGASGDLTKRKLLPALYSLAKDRFLPSNFAVVGFARRPIGDEAFREQMKEGCQKYARKRPLDEQLWQSFVQGIYYQTGEFDDPEAYKALKIRLDEIDKERGIQGNRVFYISTPPSSFSLIVKHLGDAGLTPYSEKGPFTRVIIEKPFGTDIESARALNRDVKGVLDEKQIYRIDHYLGKETVQNLLVFRFANTIFEPLWNNKYVDNVQITGAEAIGIEGRGGYFEEAGILRDMVQNHLFQIMSLAAMEPPSTFEADAVRDEKLKVLKALRRIPRDEMDNYVVRAQYSPGSVLGVRGGGYKEETGVSQSSTTDTYAAMKFYIDNWRWAGVPFYLRSGKRMPKRVTEVAIHFKHVPLKLFGNAKGAGEPNVLAIRIQPDEGISLNFGSKIPGPTNEVHPVNMDFRYGTSFGTEPPEAYERLILDCMLGDATLFTRGDEVEASWTWISRIHQAWAESGVTNIPQYESGSWGPKEADDLLARDGRRWRRP